MGEDYKGNRTLDTMARRPIPSLNTDFSAVMTFLRERRIVAESPPAQLIEHSKKIHRATYSLILWRFRLRGLPLHGKVFIEEIASDALQILPQALTGYGKTAKLLTRGIIENTLRHLYFSDHPIEFARMNREAKWYLSMETLFEYPKTHPAFLETERNFDAIGRLSSLYSDLSAGVHGRSIEDLEMRVALNKLSCDAEELKKQTDLTERCAEAANFLLAVFHREQMSKFDVEDRRIILTTMPPRARQIWSDLEAK